MRIILALSLFFFGVTFLHAEGDSDHDALNTVLLQKMFAPFKNWNLLQIEYKSETHYAERHKQLAGIEFEKTNHDYRQRGKTWSYTVNRRFNNSFDRGSEFWSDGLVDKSYITPAHDLWIDPAGEGEILASWNNPLFESFSFLLERFIRDKRREDKYNNIDSHSPLPYKLTALANNFTQFPKFVKPIQLPADPTVAWVVEFQTAASGTDTSSILNYKLFYSSPKHIFPDYFEKRGAGGQLFISIKCNDYKAVDGAEYEFPTHLETSRYLDGKIDTTTSVDVEKFTIAAKDINPVEPDSSKASQINDHINHVFLTPDALK